MLCAFSRPAQLLYCFDELRHHAQLLKGSSHLAAASAAAAAENAVLPLQACRPDHMLVATSDMKQHDNLGIKISVLRCA
jgi:hypothetical protein